MYRLAAFLFAPLVLTLVVHGRLAAQTVERIRLANPTAEFPEPFSSIAGMRELSDGRVVVSDRLEKAVRILDFGSGSLREVGRVGSGPGEYQMPGTLLPLAADSTLLVDFGNLRVIVIGPDGRIHGSTSMQHETGRFINPQGSDAEGRIYFDDLGSYSGPPDVLPDSAAILRWDLVADRFDTVGFMPRPEVRMMSAGGGGGRYGVGRMNPLEARDAWSVAPDGSLAIARSDPFHVEWRMPDGRAARGPEVTYEPVPVTDEDKEEFANRSTMGGMYTSGGEGGGSRYIRLPSPDAYEMVWPEVKPPFTRDGVRVTPEGEMWVRRYVTHGAPQVHDVFDGAGRRIKQVELPAGRRLVGFGDGVLYLVRVDEDDLQWVEQYPR